MTQVMEMKYGLPTPAEIAGKTGREIMQAIIDGALPQPTICETMSFWLAEIGDGVAVFEGDPGGHLLNPMGGIHGGWALTLIDSAAGCAAQSLLPPGTFFTTIETKGNFTRPITPGTGRVRAEGRILTNGRQIMLADVSVKDSAGKVLAHGVSTLMVLNPSVR